MGGLFLSCSLMRERIRRRLLKHLASASMDICPSRTYVKCPACKLMFGESASHPPHGALIAEAIYAMPERRPELRYLCKKCGTRWSRTFESAGYRGKPHVWEERR